MDVDGRRVLVVGVVVDLGRVRRRSRGVGVGRGGSGGRGLMLRRWSWIGPVRRRLVGRHGSGSVVGGVRLVGSVVREGHELRRRRSERVLLLSRVLEARHRLLLAVGSLNLTVGVHRGLLLMLMMMLLLLLRRRMLRVLESRSRRDGRS